MDQRPPLWADGRLAFDWETLRDYAGQGPCGYWIPFSNGLEPHVRVRGAGNPDYESDERWTLDPTVWNATDRDPPRVYRQLNYDPLAHNPLGRMIEVGLRRRL